VSALASLAPAADRMDLSGKTILVTGASRGIGAVCAISCARAGAREVILVARSQTGLSSVAREVHRDQASPRIQQCDVTDRAAIDEVFGQLTRLDVLINCAGANKPEPFLQVRERTFDRLLALNVRAPFFVSQAAARVMSGQEGGGVIVNVSSQMGHVGAPLRSVYCATKHALEGLTKALALELAPSGIRVVSVAPTYVRTDMTARQLDDPAVGPALLSKIPLGRFVTAQEVAAAVVFVASDSASALTGSSLMIDGGWTAQ
jgi:NAD(P)-dependent dehydrogenase (short-subunit alcohol dehydrogenase family)